MLAALPLDLDPSSYLDWLQDEVVPVLSPPAIASLRNWCVLRAHDLEASHGHPGVARRFVEAVEAGSYKALGVMGGEIGDRTKATNLTSPRSARSARPAPHSSLKHHSVAPHATPTATSTTIILTPSHPPSSPPSQ